MFRKLFTVLMVVALSVTACQLGSNPTPAETINYPATVAVLETNAAVTLASLQQGTAIAALLNTSTPTPNGPAVDSATPTVAATQTSVEEDNWVQIAFAPAYNVYNVAGKPMQLPLMTSFATDTSGGRYGTKEPLPSSPDLGWCKEGMADCPTHIGLVSVEVRAEDVSCVSADMDIAWRIRFVNTCGHEVQIKFGWVFNMSEDGRTAADLSKDYETVGKGGLAGLFFVTDDGLNGPASMLFNGQIFPFGYSCYDCRPDTAGYRGQPVVPLDENAELEHYGTPTVPLTQTELPGLVVPIPDPALEPDFNFLTVLTSPAHGKLTVFIGVYDAKNP